MRSGQKQRGDRTARFEDLKEFLILEEENEGVARRKRKKIMVIKLISMREENIWEKEFGE